jgi:hypothetical protein
MPSGDTMNFWARLWTSTKQLVQHPYTRQTALVIVLPALLFFGSQGIVRWTHARGQQWTAALHANATAPAKDALNLAVPMADQERTRLQAQFDQLHAREDHHLLVMTDFYAWYYMAIVMSSMTAAVAAILLFLITRNGWAATARETVITFLIMTTAAVFYRAFPATFEQEKNIAENKRLYLDYVALQNEVRTYGVTGEDTQGKKQSPAEFIHYLDNHMARINNIALGLDPTKVSTYNELQQIEKK